MQLTCRTAQLLHEDHRATLEMIEQLEESFSEEIRGRDASVNPVMASFYIRHNTGQI